MQYFRILADPALRERWFLDEPISHDGKLIDAREFTQSKPYLGQKPADIPIQRSGKRISFNLAAFDMPVLSDEIVSELQEFAPNDVFVYPVLINRDISGFNIVNVIAAERCLDENGSNILWWKPEDGVVNKIGQYRMVTNITVNSNLANGRHILRIEGWKIALIVSEFLKDKLMRVDGLGVIFAPVN